MKHLWLAVLLASACVGPLDGAPGGRDLTSNEGAEHLLEFQSFVYVPDGASDTDIQWAIRRQVKSSLGALRERGIGIRDRDARSNLDPAGWVRTPLVVVGEDGTPVETLERVTFAYHDVALVDRDRIPSGPFDLTLLFGDYAARRDELVPACVDDPDAAADSLWYHYHPGRWACRNRIRNERDVIAAASSALDDPSSQIALVDRDRRFVTTRVALAPVDDPPELYPEHHRLWGFAGNTDRTHLVVYSFFGVDRDVTDPGDYGLRETLRFQRRLRQRFPELRVVHTEPFAMLLDFWLDGQRVEGVTFHDVERWILDGTGFPAAASTAARRAELRRQVVERYAERWVVWEMPVSISDGETTREMTVQIRVFYGEEDGSWEIRQRARWRYLEAFWHADVFAYTGHSHFGYGPLSPQDYGPQNFPERYQVMLINSCLSFNYYDQDFLDMHPGGSQNLDVVVNGLAAYWYGMGHATAGYVIGLVDGEARSWREILDDMRVNLPWEAGYDPMRAVNGELDNVYAPETFPLFVD